MTISWRQYSTEHPRITDAALVVLLLSAASGSAMLNSELSTTDNLGWPSAVPLAAAGALAMLWRRSRPRTVVLVTAVCAGTAGAIGYLITPVLLLPVMVALYELAQRAPRRTTLLGYLFVLAAVVVPAGVVDRYEYPWFLTIFSPMLFLLLPVVLAESARLRRDYLSAELAGVLGRE